MIPAGNPFTVQTPEDIPAEQVVELFVPVFTDYPKILGAGHVFVHGPRGCGKSMIFRYLQPDCQLIDRKERDLSALEFFSIYAPLKNCDLKLTELRRLEEQHASVILNEHFMVMYIAGKAFSTLSSLTQILKDEKDLAITKAYVLDVFFRLLHKCGYAGDGEARSEDYQSVGEYFTHLHRITDELFTDVVNYLRKLAFKKEIVPFNGPLCGYLDFLFPLLKELNKLSFMPGEGKPIYLLIDDADNLNQTQIRILNTWVSSRTSRFVSIKISTQMQYKTFRTVTGQSIDTPHDYSEINISTTYTSSKGRYRDRVREIVSKRLEHFRINNVTTEKFFPKDEEQERRIREIGAQ